MHPRLLPKAIALALIHTLIQAAPLTSPAEPIPKNSERATVLQASEANRLQWKKLLPKADLPEGYSIQIVAAEPLVTHPTMGCVDDRGRLFIGDAVGVNWNKAQLEANPPNRVLLLEDTDHDGTFDKSTVFADKMTFPQGACWLNGSLYVASPPGIWKLTDSDGDGIADQREMIVTGFDYTGNAADIHGPFAHPNGRLYWCHGRKGHRVTQKDGSLVDESLASGIWSCRADGSDVQWHSLGCGDNPVEVDFTPEGDIIGVENLYYSQPRGDTLVHWLFGGIYERPDQLQAIAHRLQTLDRMPVIHNFGHVAVSGCCFWNRYSGIGTQAPGRQFMVTHFNTQRLVRIELAPAGATYRATENEFLKLHNPDIHLTDVMESADGSLLLLDGGGWFRIGCPSSLMAKPDTLGAIYRITPSHASPQSKTKSPLTQSSLNPHRSPSLEDFAHENPHRQRQALEFFAAHPPAQNSKEYAAFSSRILQLMGNPMDSVREHFLIYLGRLEGVLTPDLLRAEKNKLALRRMLACFSPKSAEEQDLLADLCSKQLDDSDRELARVSLKRLVADPDRAEEKISRLQNWLSQPIPTAHQIDALENFTIALALKPNIQSLLQQMLEHRRGDIQTAALRVIAALPNGISNTAWEPSLKQILAANPSPLVLEALKKLKGHAFDADLQALASDPKLPMAIRLKALDAVKTVKLTSDLFDMLKGVLKDSSASAGAKIQASTMLASSTLNQDQILQCDSILSYAGPVELKTLLPLIRKSNAPEVGKTLARALTANPAFTALQESVYRTAFSGYPAEIFEQLLLPCLKKASEIESAKMRQLAPLSEKATSTGNAQRGKSVFEAGKGSCIACHKIGSSGKSIGPDLSTIGSIRTSRDLLESIIFPSNTLARDYEAHVIETSDGQQTIGVIRSHSAEGLLVVDLAGQEKTIRHETITANATLTTSLMPSGLESTLTEQELLDLVAWLSSLH